MNGMRKKLLIVGVALVAVSAVAATQYARAELSYTYNINHPSNGFIRFVGGDNATDGMRVLRADATNTTLELDFGEMTAGVNKTYTAAFAIVNEENFSVDITDIEVATTSGADYLHIWLHGDPTAAGGGTFMWDGSNGDQTPGDGTAWTLAAGNSNPADMDGTSIATTWDSTAEVRYTEDTTPAADGNDDYVWVQISLDIPSNPDGLTAHTGTISFDFQATTH